MTRLRDERGASFVLFSVMLPLILLVGAIAVDVGNWFVHQKHLQSQADAAAFAGGLEFNGCFQQPAMANTVIANAALKYSGDTNRPVAGTPYNVQEQEPTSGQVHVVLNSRNYWATGDAIDGSTRDNTEVAPYTPSDASKPCATRALDVKATDDKAPLIFGFIPVASSPHGHARVEIHKVPSVSGMLPFAVPEVAPVLVGAIIVNEADGSVVGAQWLNPQNFAAPDPRSQWSMYGGDLSSVNVNNNEAYNTVIITSRDAAATLTGSLATICGQNPTQVTCYGKPVGATTGLSFIHAYSGANGNLANPVLHQVELTQGCPTDASAPYFNLGGGCSIQVQAVLSMGVSGDPTVFPNCARIPGWSWSAGGIGGADGTWTNTIMPASDSGRNVVSIPQGTTRKNGGTNCNNATSQNIGGWPTVAAPYVANPDTTPSSGPVQYLTITDNNRPGGVFANSINKTSNASIHVLVGLTPPLLAANLSDPPIALRYASVSGSQNQAVDCDKNVTFRDEIVAGCQNYYTENARNGSCAGYNTGNLPQTPVNAPPGDDCVAVETGDKSGQIRQALDMRFGRNGGPNCQTLNYWPNPAGQPMNPNNPSGTVPDFTTDKRVVVLFITDDSTFGGSGTTIYPNRRFAAFYITAADGLNCPGDYPSNPGSKNVWGHWISYTVPNPNSDPGPDLCDFSIASICAPVLVE